MPSVHYTGTGGLFKHLSAAAGWDSLQMVQQEQHLEKQELEIVLTGLFCKIWVVCGIINTNYSLDYILTNQLQSVPEKTSFLVFGESFLISSAPVSNK